jgi:hypothetical protein
MSSKSQLFSVSSVCPTPLHQQIGQSWGSLPANLQETKFLRSWLVYDSLIQTGAPRGVNWNVVLGLALVTAASALMWTGIGLMITRVWN